MIQRYAFTSLILVFITAAVTACESDTQNDRVEGRWYSQSQVDSGQVIFTDNCASCHGNNAESTPNWKQTFADGSYPPPPLNGSAHAWHHPLSALKRSIKNGGVALGGKMPAFKDKLSEADEEAVIAFFQSKWNKKIYDAWLARGGLK